jgi:hypothetical protein
MKDPKVRGLEIENELATTDYADWFHVGRTHRGKFPLVDFQKGRTLVSVKSTNAFTERSFAELQDHIDDLATRGATVDGYPARLVLDVRVPPGHEGLLKELIEYGGGRGIEVRIKPHY